MRKLGIDLGDMRIGFALSDPLGIIASPLETYKRVSWETDTAYIDKLIKANSVDTIVMGLPLNMDGSEGERVTKTREFASKISARTPDVAIVYQDERLTTVQAERSLIEDADMSRRRRGQVIDKQAAQLILSAYLEKMRNLKGGTR